MGLQGGCRHGDKGMYLSAVFEPGILLTKSPLCKIFVADEPEVEALPRHEVAQYLEDLHKPACIQYLEHIVNELGEAGPDFHDKLVELYLEDAKRDWKKGVEGV